jgi:hypothetical protein
MEHGRVVPDQQRLVIVKVSPRVLGALLVIEVPPAVRHGGTRAVLGAPDTGSILQLEGIISACDAGARALYFELLRLGERKPRRGHTVHFL